MFWAPEKWGRKQKEYEAITKRDKGGGTENSTLLENIPFLDIPFLLVLLS